MALNNKKQPVLVGTVSIEKNELLSGLLKKRGVKHEVLNAKFHEREAEIISLAGQSAAVTIATNMAGRGTDIVLGAGVKEVGGLRGHRHRTPRKPAHRQPAARPLRPPRRPGLVALLRFPGG